jgi:uncharacterized protein (TIGR02453 family)
MSFFSSAYLDFFTELERNNNKSWFDANRKRYEEQVKAPFLTFVAELLERLQVHDPELAINPKDCIARINRDIRFSKDKSPYNLYCTAFLSPAGRKDKSHPGLYFRFGARDAGIMAGCYQPSREQLERIRRAIAAEPEKFRTLLEAKPLRELFGELRGERMKRIPPEWREACEKEALVANKQFYLVSEREAGWITDPGLTDQLLEYWHAARPLNDFLRKSILGE